MLSDAKLNRLVGIAPEEKQSGTKEWQRRIWGGRKDVRNALYMAAVASIKWNAVLGSYYRKKRAEGHPHKWAIVRPCASCSRCLTGSRGIRASRLSRSPSRRSRMPMSDEERKLRSSRVRGMVSLPFLLLPRTPSSSFSSFSLRWRARLEFDTRKQCTKILCKIYSC